MAEQTIELNEEKVKAILAGITHATMLEELANLPSKEPDRPNVHSAEAYAMVERQKRDPEKEINVNVVVLGQTEEERTDILKEGTEDNYQSALLKEWSGIRDVAQTYLQTWDKTKLREAWINWSEYNPKVMSPDFAKAREEVRQCLRIISQQKGCFGYLTTGEEYEAQSPLQLTDVDAAEVKNENPELGEKYGAFIEGNTKMRDPIDLVLSYKNWQALQAKHNLSSNYSTREIATYSASAKAVFKVLKVLQEKLALHGITDITNSEQIKKAVRQETGRQVVLERIRKTTAGEGVSGPHRTEAPVVQPRETQRQEAFEETSAPHTREVKGENVIDRRMDTSDRDSVMRAWIHQKVEETRTEQRQQQLKESQKTPSSSTRSDYSIARADLSRALDTPEAIEKMSQQDIPDFVARADTMSPDEIFDTHVDGDEMAGTKNYDKIAAEVQDQSWDDFSGWSEDARVDFRQQIMAAVGVKQEAADRILTSLLLNGQTAEHVERQLGASPNARHINDYLDGLNILITDEEVLKILYPLEDDREFFLDQHKFQRTPRNIEQLAWQMAHQEGDHFKQGGPYEMFRRGIREGTGNDGKKNFEFVERVNPENMIMWIRAIQLELHGLKQDGSIDFTHEVKLKKEISEVNIHRMLENKAVMFKSKNGKMYDKLAGMFEREAMFFQITREFRISYIQNYGDEKKLQEARLNQFYLNLLTKPLYGKSFFYWVHMMPEAYTKDHESDSKMGAAINTMFMAYNYLTNPEELKRVLQVDSLNELFSKKKLEDMREVLAAKGDTDPSVFCDLGKFSKAFNQDGSLNMADGGAEVIAMLNFYTQNTPSESLKNIIRGIIKERAADLHGLRDTKHGEDISINKSIAELMAYDMSWFMGVGTINDVNNAGFNAEVRAGDAYRFKQATDRGGKWGNLWTIGQFKRWLIMPMHAIRTTVAGGETHLLHTKDEDGNPIVKEVKNSKTIFEEMDGLSKMRVRKDAELTARVKAAIDSEDGKRLITEKMAELKHIQEHHGNKDWLEEYKDEGKLRKLAEKEVKNDLRDKLWDKEDQAAYLKEYKKEADHFIFKENASRDYYLNHYVRGFQLDERLRGAKDIRFDKFITHDPLLGAVFRQEDYQQEMSGLITAARYTFQTYGELNYDSLVWAWNPNLHGDKKGGMEQVPLGKSMFGHQLANIPELTTHGLVDWTKVNSDAGKKILFKRWVEVFITGQILQYRALTRWSNHPRYSYAMLEDILEGISKIPKGLEFDEHDMRSVDVTGFFFDKEAIKRIRKQSGTGWMKVLLTEMFVRGLFGKDKDGGFFSGLGGGFGIFFSAVVSSR